jgi:hypothetical protein
MAIFAKTRIVLFEACMSVFRSKRRIPTGTLGSADRIRPGGFVHKITENR